MTRTQAQILELFHSLAADEKRELAQQIVEAALTGSFFDGMSDAQRAELKKAIGEADRGEGEIASDFFAKAAQRHGFSRMP